MVKMEGLPVSKLKKAMTTYPVAGPEKANWKRYMFGKKAIPYINISRMIYNGCIFPFLMPKKDWLHTKFEICAIQSTKFQQHFHGKGESFIIGCLIWGY